MPVSVENTENSKYIASIADTFAMLLGVRTHTMDRLMVDGGYGKKTRPLSTKGHLLHACECALLDHVAL